MHYFDNHPEYFEYKKGVPFYLQKNFEGGNFEDEYLNIRKKEDRLYFESQVKDLPRIYEDHPLYHEWRVRGRSAKKLIKRLKKEKPKLVVEVGCGNGWLTNLLQRDLQVPTIGVDVNETEMTQAASIFWDGWNHYVYGDILSDCFQDLKPDAIVLAASAQYFPDLRQLLSRLVSMLNDNGTIHILDTPFYKTGKALEAKTRSADYFRSMDASGMEKFYFHHEVDVLKEFNARFLYRPNALTKLLNKYNSPFPWVMIRKG